MLNTPSYKGSIVFLIKLNGNSLFLIAHEWARPGKTRQDQASLDRLWIICMPIG